MRDRKRIRAMEDGLDQRLSPRYRRRYAETDEPVGDPDTLLGEQFRETDEIRGGPAVPFLTGPMWRGMIGGGLLGLVIGAVLALPFAFIPMADINFLGRVAIVVVSGGAGGATVGAVYFGARTSELSGESYDADNKPSSGSSLADPHTDERGR